MTPEEQLAQIEQIAAQLSPPLGDALRQLHSHTMVLCDERDDLRARLAVLGEPETEYGRQMGPDFIVPQTRRNPLTTHERSVWRSVWRPVESE